MPIRSGALSIPGTMPTVSCPPPAPEPPNTLHPDTAKTAAEMTASARREADSLALTWTSRIWLAPSSAEGAESNVQVTTVSMRQYRGDAPLDVLLWGKANLSCPYTY